jgi:PAS domain S-box-containing protein
VLVLARDITTQKRAAETLRESAAMLRLAQHAGGIATFDWDFTRGHARCSPEFFEMYGLESRDGVITSEDWDRFIHPEDRDAMAAHITRALAGEDTPAADYRIIRADGRVRWLTYSGQFVGDDAHGERMLGTVVDITERKLVEARLRDSQERLRLALDAASAGSWEWDIGAADIGGAVSEEAMRLWGVSADNAPRTFEGWLALIHPEDRERVAAAYQRAAVAGGDIDIDFRIPLEEAGARWLQVIGRVQQDTNQRAVWMSGITLDVTSRKEAEEALRESDRRKDEFIAMLAHELRNPLAPIRYAVAMLERPDLPPETAARARDVINRQVVHLVRLVDDLLDVSRISRGKIELRKRRLNLQDTLQSALDACAPIVEESSLRLHASLPASPIWVDADPNRLVQVLTNLLNNAIKYTPAPGDVWVTCQQDGEQAVIRVRDSGIGIERDDLPRVFEKFTQVAHDPVSQSGLGLGLSLVHTLVEMHGGTVTASSEGPGKGSEFVVYLPAARAPLGTATSLTATVGTIARPKRVLIVDDNEDLVEMSNMLVQSFGHETAVARDGPTALALAGSFRPDVVLLDIGMPGMDGYEVARRLRADATHQGVTLIAITGWGQDDDRRRTREAGFDHHLTKPPDPEQLRLLLSSAEARPLASPPSS